MLFTSGKLEGGWFDIISNTENELEISIRRHDKLNLSINDKFEIIQHYTISEFLKYGINVNPRMSDINDPRLNYNKYFNDLEQNTGIKRDDPKYPNLKSASLIEFKKHDKLTGVQMSTSVNHPSGDDNLSIHLSTYNHINIWETGDYVSLNSEKTDLITLNDSICVPYHSIVICNGTTKGELDNHTELGSVILCGNMPNHRISYEFFSFIENAENTETQILEVKDIKESLFDYGIPSLTDITLSELNDNDWIGIDKFGPSTNPVTGDVMYVIRYKTLGYHSAVDNIYKYRISSTDPNTQHWVIGFGSNIASNIVINSKDIFKIGFRTKTYSGEYDYYKIGRLSFKPNYVK